MKKCINCKCNVKDTDIYCRNCGCLLQSNKNYIMTNVLIIFLIFGIIFIIGLFFASYIL